MLSRRVHGSPRGSGLRRRRTRTRPGEHGEDRVVEHEEPEVAADAADARSGSPAAGRAAAAAARARGRRRPSRRRACRRRRCRRPRAPPQRPSVPSRPWKNTANAGSATTSAAARNASTAIDFAEPDRAAVARRRTSASNIPCSRSGTNARVRPSSAVKTSADQRRPSARCRSSPSAARSGRS